MDVGEVTMEQIRGACGSAAKSAPGPDGFEPAEMALLSVSAWLASILYQSTYSGVDMTLVFPWLSCKNEANSTWLGGFEWEC